MVIGDFMLDTYTIGKAARISPEAPVAVLQVEHEERRPGGAGNVSLNLAALGAQVVAIGRVGKDNNGKILLDALTKEGIDVTGMLIDSCFSTPVKNRVIADHQQLVRVDYEQVLPLHELLEQRIIDMIPKSVDGVGFAAVSDYGKGLITPVVMQAMIEYSKKKGIPVLVDPKGIDYRKYRGAHILKPNLSEAYAAANLPRTAPLEQVASHILKISDAEIVMITRSEEGISLFFRNGDRKDFPVAIREVRDVTGAGDTVLAVVVYALANGLPIEDAVHLSNLAAGIAVEKFGCTQISLSELARRMAGQDVRNKVFDHSHFPALKEALRERRSILLEISGHEGLTTAICIAIQTLAQEEERDLVVYVRDCPPQKEVIRALASLNEVNYLVVNGKSLNCLIDFIQPDTVYRLEKGQLKSGLCGKPLV